MQELSLSPLEWAALDAEATISALEEHRERMYQVRNNGGLIDRTMRRREMQLRDLAVAAAHALQAAQGVAR